jgi:glycosyltransferase involved in cell wall biosynthesis
MDFGGAETFIMNIYRKIDRSKIQFDFLVQSYDEFDYSDEIEKLGGKIYVVEGRRKGIIKNRKELDLFFSTHSYYNAVHLHTNCLSYIEPLIYAKKHKIGNLIVHGHSTNISGNSLHRIIHKANQLFLKYYSTKNVACSVEVAKWMFGNKVVDFDEYEIINNGIEVQNFRFNKSDRNRYRDEFELNNKTVVGHIGRFIDVKNHKYIIQILNELRNIKPDVSLLLIGDGPLRSNIEKQVHELGLKKYVYFLGKRGDVNRILNAMDIFVFPSLYEGLPLTLVEAQASGLTCIVSDRISDEVLLTDRIIKMPIDVSPIEWAEKIVKYSRDSERDNKYEAVINGGYDSENALNKVLSLYN